MSQLLQTEYLPPHHVIYLRDLYPQGFQAPAGLELTGEFRPPVSGELYIPANSRSHVSAATGLHKHNDPRLILRKVRVKVVTFRSTGEDRFAKKGEWYQDHTGMFWRAASNHKAQTNWIFTRTETEE